MYYRIGLDIGITSVGWCAVETDASGEPKSILDLGARIFDAAEQPKTGASLAEPRRLARGLRRRLRRRALRLALAKELFAELGVAPEAAPRDVNELRVAGLDNLLEEREFAAVLLLLLKRRGFKSNSKAQNSKEDGELLSATKRNAELMAERGYRTVGEMLAAEYSEKRTRADGSTYTVYNVRNKGGSYAHTVRRADIRQEIEALFAAQAGFGSALASDEVKDRVLEIFDMQRNFDDGPGKGSKYSATYAVGKCEFLEDEERAPRASYSNERFVALQKINHLRIISGGKSRELTAEEREKLIALAEKNKKTTYAAVRKTLGLGDGERFNALTYSTKKENGDEIKESEKATFVTFERSRAISDCLDEEHRTADIIDAAAYVLSHVKSDSRRLKMFADVPETAVLSDAEKEGLLAVNCDKFGHLSVKAIRAIIPYLEQGQRYDEACKSAGFHHSEKQSEDARSLLLKGSAVAEETENITSPVVRRAVAQTLKVLNAIIGRYGSPVAINIELAREMSKSRAERDKATRENEKRRKNNDTLRETIKEMGVVPTYTRLLMMKLYEEQKGQCPYTGETIAINRLFEDNYVQIDHIIPYSRCFNDSLNNKVLVKTRANQDKGNRTPFEWLFTTPEWNDFFDRVNGMYAGNFKKKQMLLKESFDEEEWKSRALNDTRYICRYMRGLLADRLLFEEAEMGTQRVFAVNGGITAELRRQWGIGKVREDGDIHHAVDAAIIACVTPGAVRKLSAGYKKKHEEKRYKEEGYGAEVTEPYAGFADELAARCMEDEELLRDRLRALGFDENTVLKAKPVFVSRMPKRKGTGPIHKETIQSAKYVEDGISVKKVALTELKLERDKNGEWYIKDYFRPEDDRKTYELLLDKLIAANGNAKVAFAEKVFKPAAEGKIPNEIKKVKLYYPVNSGVMLEDIKGFADNGSMVRVDVFSKNGKYYCVPVYTADIYAGRLPDRAATAGKKLPEWDVMDDTYKFEFALYPNDLIWIKSKKDICMSKQRDNNNSRMSNKSEVGKYGVYVYYRGLDIATASAAIITHNNCYLARGVGLKTIGEIKKCVVDVLGNISFVQEEKRPPAKIKQK